jgi:hypothetical protein
VFITVQGPPNGRRTALNVVRQEFQRIHDTVPGLVVDARVPLPDDPAVTVGYVHLLALEKDGEQYHRPEGAKKRYAVKELLDGVTTFAERQEDRRRGDTYNIDLRGGTMSVEKPNTSIRGNTIIGSTLNWGEISGNVTNLVRQLPPRRKDGPDLKAVLDALLIAIRDAAEKQELPADEAKDAVAEVEVIAESAKEPTEPKMLEKANKAVRGLARIVAGVAALGTKVTELKDVISGWFAS